MESWGAVGAEEDNGQLFWGNWASFLSEEFFNMKSGEGCWREERMAQQSMHRCKRRCSDMTRSSLRLQESGERRQLTFLVRPSPHNGLLWEVIAVREKMRPLRLYVPALCQAYITSPPVTLSDDQGSVSFPSLFSCTLGQIAKPDRAFKNLSDRGIIISSLQNW